MLGVVRAAICFTALWRSWRIRKWRTASMDRELVTVTTVPWELRVDSAWWAPGVRGAVVTASYSRAFSCVWTTLAVAGP